MNIGVHCAMNNTQNTHTMRFSNNEIIRQQFDLFMEFLSRTDQNGFLREFAQIRINDDRDELNESLLRYIRLYSTGNIWNTPNYMAAKSLWHLIQMF